MRLIESLVCGLTAPLGVFAGCVDDKCLRAVAKTPNAGRNGTADCEAYLRFTTTVTAVETVTASTETLVRDQTTTVAQTLTVVETVTATQTVPPASSGSVVFVRAAAAKASEKKPEIPPYAHGHCRSFEQYQSACSRIGVLPTTITVAGATVQTSVTATTVVTSVVTVPTTNAAVSLTTTATATVTATSTPETPNIVPNGGFESGTLDGWTVADNTTGEVVSPGSHSSFCLRLGPMDGGGRETGPFPLHQVRTTVSATRGANYSCSFEWAFERYVLSAMNHLPALYVYVNGAIVATPFMRGQPEVWQTWRAQFNYTSMGEDLLEFMAYSAQDASSRGENYFKLDNVVCVPAA
ncbi:uncharacterized protein B0T15DRAFT_261401 [Chaetomium strumarium]|uniref:CBM11 domain-containing protein n=1 Tax=Chaetomium strumarium TaxID=1170767 RepID=A0AAJ0LZ46_9PEZI|nr:hypothetical protein B0T15DRAFT_261401 [Chaetomium strumarium]